MGCTEARSRATRTYTVAAEKGHDRLLDFLIKQGCDVDAQEIDEAGARTPLHLAAAAGHLRAAEVLLAANANPNATDDEGNTVLHVAARNRNSIFIAKLLLSFGAEPSRLDRYGFNASCTYLPRAMFFGWQEMRATHPSHSPLSRADWARDAGNDEFLAIPGMPGPAGGSSGQRAITEMLKAAKNSRGKAKKKGKKGKKGGKKGKKK